jgi:hypothetical protein
MTTSTSFQSRRHPIELCLHMANAYGQAPFRRMRVLIRTLVKTINRRFTGLTLPQKQHEVIDFRIPPLHPFSIE